MENVTHKFGGLLTYEDREGFLWNDIVVNGNRQRVVYTDYSGWENERGIPTKSSIALVWGKHKHQSEVSFLNVSLN